MDTDAGKGTIMWALWMIPAVIAIIAFLLSFHINIYIKFNSGGTSEVYLRYLFLKFKVYPAKEKVEPERKKKIKKKDKVVRKKPETVEKETAKGIGYYLELVKAILERIVEFFPNHLKIQIFDFTVTAATDDAAKTALLFGGISAATDIIRVFIRSNFNVKYENIHVNSDFLTDKTTFNIDMRIYIRIISAVMLGMSVIGDKFKVDKNNKTK